MSSVEIAPRQSSSPTLTRMLDRVHDQIVSGRVRSAMDDLFAGLRRCRSQLDTNRWKAAVREECIPHPVAREIFRDPISRHSFEQPRGYPGDAELLDRLYGIHTHGADRSTCPIGRQIRDYLFDAPAARAVRTRRRILAETVDQCAVEVDQPRVLSIAAGHLREVDLGQALQAGRIGEYVAFDQDNKSLAQIDRDYGLLGVTTVPGSVRGILGGRQRFADFDLVYASGLYDYLKLGIATRLTALMFRMLRPGGRLLVANFVPTIPDAGFMESYMGWDLIYRDRSDMLAMTSEIPEAEVASMRVCGEENQALLFLEVKRR